MLYKIISNVLANRLKLVLLGLIYETLSAFVLRRLIINNAIVAFEVFHSIKHCIKSKKGVMAVKLDMSKACKIMWN